jgi:hypothetical protein
MLGCDSNFTEPKDFSLAIIIKRDTITLAIILLKGCEHPSLPGHMICSSAIYHPTHSTGGVCLQNKLSLAFRYPRLIESSQVSNKALGHPHTRFWPLVVWPNMQGNDFSNLVSDKNIRYIKIMIRHMRNMRGINIEFIRERSIISSLDCLLLCHTRF